MMTISTTQQQVLDRMRATGEPLVRRPGGFFTLPSVPKGHFEGPEWYVNISTVRSMEKKGLLVRANEYPEEWKDTRCLPKQ